MSSPYAFVWIQFQPLRLVHMGPSAREINEITIPKLTYSKASELLIFACAASAYCTPNSRAQWECMLALHASIYIHTLTQTAIHHLTNDSVRIAVGGSFAKWYCC